MQRRLLYDPNLRIIFSVTLMAVLGVSSVTPAFPAVMAALGIPSSRVGLLISVFTVPGVVLTPVMGILADRLGRKEVLVPSLILFALAGAACSLAGSFSMLLLLRFFQGVGAAALGAVNVTLLGDLFDGRDRVAAFGLNASVLSVGTAVYPALGGILAAVDWRYPFAMPLLALPVAKLVSGSLAVRPLPKSASFGSYVATLGRHLRNRGVAAILVASLLSFVVLYGAYLTYLPILVSEQLHAGARTIGACLAASSLATALSASQLWRLARLVGERWLVAIAFLVFAAALAMMPLAGGVGSLLVAIVPFGGGLGICIPAYLALLTKVSPTAERGAFMAVNGSILRLGQTVGPLLAGLLYASCGLGSVFRWAALLSVFCAVYMAVELPPSPARG